VTAACRARWWATGRDLLQAPSVVTWADVVLMAVLLRLATRARKAA
jgi:hypothetical protein